MLNPTMASHPKGGAAALMVNCPGCSTPVTLKQYSGSSTWLGYCAIKRGGCGESVRQAVNSDTPYVASTALKVSCDNCSAPTSRYRGKSARKDGRKLCVQCAADERRHAPTFKTQCAECDMTFTYKDKRGRKYCSRQCAHTAERRRARAARRQRRNNRTPRVKGNKGGRITVDKRRARIAHAASYRCRHCRKLTQLHDPNADNAATVDHIIPYSISQDDGPTNLQLLCRKCNEIKNDGILPTDQLMLVAS